MHKKEFEVPPLLTVLSLLSGVEVKVTVLQFWFPAFRASCQALSHAVTQPEALMGLPGGLEALVLRL